MSHEKGRWVPLERMKSFQALGSREQNAVDVVLEWLEQRQTPDSKEPKRIRIIITPKNPFDLKAFAGFLYASAGVDVTSTMKTEKNKGQTAITFQPKYYPIPKYPEKISDPKSTFEKIAKFLSQ